MAVHGVCNGGWWVRNAIFHHLPTTRPARAFEGAGFKRHFCRALLAARLRGRGQEQRFEGQGECFIELGGGVAGFARGNFYADPTPQVRMFRAGRHWHAAKVAFERNWWRTWL